MSIRMTWQGHEPQNYSRVQKDTVFDCNYAVITNFIYAVVTGNYDCIMIAITHQLPVCNNSYLKYVVNYSQICIHLYTTACRHDKVFK